MHAYDIPVRLRSRQRQRWTLAPAGRSWPALSAHRFIGAPPAVPDKLRRVGAVSYGARHSIHTPPTLKRSPGSSRDEPDSTDERRTGRSMSIIGRLGYGLAVEAQRCAAICLIPVVLRKATLLACNPEILRYRKDGCVEQGVMSRAQQ